jgi:8-oxo-dGTP pyrophosphatase MutT (NUDIX family)
MSILKHLVVELIAPILRINDDANRSNILTLHVSGYAFRAVVQPHIRSFSALADVLISALAKPLPGRDAHMAMAPQPRRAWPRGVAPDDMRHAAGLVLVFPDDDDRANLVLTVRADTLGRHGGQVSLPGGVVEPGESFPHAALREAHEEIALDPNLVRVAGPLTPIDIPVSGFRLHPIVGVADQRPSLSPADGEVARILEVPIEALTAPGCVVDTTRERDGNPIVVPAFCVAGEEIWGATAMVLAEFLSLVGWARR